MMRFVLAILLCILPTQVFSASNGISVAVSIKPIHSLVSNMLQGITEPHLIVSAAGSPHGYNLRPSELRMLEDADLIVWTGPELETFLSKPLQHRNDKQVVVTLLRDLPQLEILPAREGGNWEGHTKTGDHNHEHGHFDPHLWLSPKNAGAIADALLQQLAAIDSENEPTYRKNHARLTERLSALEKQISLMIAPVKQQKYIVFHDAYQYFERSFGLLPLGALAVDPDRRPGARRLKQLQKQIKEASVECVFTEPQFAPRLVNTLIEGTVTKTAILDPLGADLPPGPELYFELMLNLATSLSDCLAGRE